VNKIIRFAALAGALCLPLLGLVPAGASNNPTPPGPSANSPTIQCQVVLPGFCLEPGFAQAIPSSQNLVPSSDIALTTTGQNGSLFADIDNNAQDGSQDFAFVPLGTVPSSGHGAFGFTPKDNLLYHGDLVAELSWFPFGQDLGQCAQETRLKHFVLRACDDGHDQIFILDQGRIPLVGTTPPGYFRVMPITHTASLAGHDCVTGRLSSVVDAERCVRRLASSGGPQFLTRIP
jgi:hypothetical protein